MPLQPVSWEQCEDQAGTQSQLYKTLCTKSLSWMLGRTGNEVCSSHKTLTSSSMSLSYTLQFTPLGNPIGRNGCILTFTSPVRTGSYEGFWVSSGGQVALGKQIQEINYLQRSQRIWI